MKVYNNSAVLGQCSVYFDVCSIFVRTPPLPCSVKQDDIR